MGKADAAASVPGPALEKKTENGVWLATGNSLPASDPVDMAKDEDEADDEVETGIWPAPRTLVAETPAVTLAAANRGAALSGSGCPAGFKIDGAAVCPFTISDSVLAVPAGSPGSF